MNKRKGIISMSSYVNVTRMYRKNIPFTIIRINAVSPVAYLLPVKAHLFINVANTSETTYTFDSGMMRAYSLTNKSTNLPDIYTAVFPPFSALSYSHVRVIK